MEFRVPDVNSVFNLEIRMEDFFRERIMIKEEGDDTSYINMHRMEKIRSVLLDMIYGMFSCPLYGRLVHVNLKGVDLERIKDILENKGWKLDYQWDPFTTDKIKLYPDPDRII